MALYDHPNTPGVKLVEKSLLPPSIVQVSTAIPVFLGYTQDHHPATAADAKAVRVSSLKDYEDIFGKGHAYAFAYTQTGSTFTVTKPDMDFFLYESIRLYFMNGGGACYIISLGDTSTNPSSTDFQAGLDLIDKLDEPTLISFPEAVYLDHVQYGVVASKAMNICGELKDKFTLVDSPSDLNLKDFDANSLVGLAAFRGTLAGKASYGAVYYPSLETTIKVAVDQTGFPGVQTADYRTLMTEIDKLAGITIPPSALLAGVYARVDREKGVWKAPANMALQGVVKPEKQISDADQNHLNVDADSGKSVNALREFSGKGTVVWGARTLDGNSNEWRYINVRRLFITVEESVKKATSQFVFENNDAKTWVKVNSMITSYLNGLWKDGGLLGAAPDEAYFVEVGLGTTMTQDDILNGKMIVRIGLAAVRPAEFIILEFSHFINQ
ncbi:MAG: phage tail sheath protein FI [Crocinitomix sp.]|jgi:phage tail sheath protein FI